MCHYDELIHNQPKEWPIKTFSQGNPIYPISVAGLTRNIVWQTREGIFKKEKTPLPELLLT